MDRTMKREAGFTLIELMIVLAIIGVLSGVAINRITHFQSVNSVNEDMYKISSFFHEQKLFAFTQKQAVDLTIGANQITTIRDPGGLNLAGPTLNLQNVIRSSIPLFTASTRGNLTTGNISVNAVNTGAEYSCVQMANIRIRLGVWNGTNCNPI